MAQGFIQYNAGPKNKVEDSVKHKQKKEQRFTRMFTVAWQTQAEKVIKEKIAHYKATGNLNKLAIYQLKLKHNQNIKTKIKEFFKL